MTFRREIDGFPGDVPVMDLAKTLRPGHANCIKCLKTSAGSAAARPRPEQQTIVQMYCVDRIL